MNAAKTRSCPFAFTIAAADTPQWISLSGASAIPADTEAGLYLSAHGVPQPKLKTQTVRCVHLELGPIQLYHTATQALGAI